MFLLINEDTYIHAYIPRFPTLEVMQGAMVVDSMSVLGVTITSDLRAEQHLSRIL